MYCPRIFSRVFLRMFGVLIVSVALVFSGSFFVQADSSTATTAGAPRVTYDDENYYGTGMSRQELLSYGDSAAIIGGPESMDISGYSYTLSMGIYAHYYTVDKFNRPETMDPLFSSDGLTIAKKQARYYLENMAHGPYAHAPENAAYTRDHTYAFDLWYNEKAEFEHGQTNTQMHYVNLGKLGTVQCYHVGYWGRAFILDIGSGGYDCNKSYFTEYNRATLFRMALISAKAGDPNGTWNFRSLNTHATWENVLNDDARIWAMEDATSYAERQRIWQDDPFKEVTSLQISPSPSSVHIGKTVQLTASVAPSDATYKAVSWKSSNESVATVDANGKVTGKKVGTATITATARDGSGVSESVQVSVIQPVTSVTVSGVSSVRVGSSTQLSASVSPSNASDKGVSWKSSNGAIASVDANGKVTGRKAGTVTITATAKDGSGKSGSFTVTVNTKWVRLWGNHYFDTMAEISKAGFTQADTDTVVIATSAGYQDALAANSIAGVYDAPILFVEPKKLPAQTKAELTRLKPKRVIVAGGRYVVSDDVLSDIQKVTGVKPDRYWGNLASDTADALAKAAGKDAWFESAIVVTDASYWDALSVGPYAYVQRAPIFYAQGGKKLSSSTLQTMKDLGITQVYIIGGPYAVKTDVDKQIKAKGMKVTRKYGQTMINTSQAVAEFALEQGMQVDGMGIATTNGYYDGLAAGPLLGRNNSVLVLTDSKDLSAINNVYGKNKAKVSRGYIFGGKYAVADSVFTHVNK